jgi:ABC-type branched-subunit amino acid transport system substrate-binding protein
MARAYAPSSARSAARLLLIIAIGALSGLHPGPAAGAPRAQKIRIGVVGDGSDGRLLEATADGARLAAERMASADLEIGVEVADDAGTAAGLQHALKRLKRAKVLGIIAAPSGPQTAAWWKSAAATKIPVLFVTSVAPDLERNRGSVWHLAPSLAAQAVEAADTALAPLGARRIGVVHEPTDAGRLLAGTFARNLSRHVALAGVLEWPEAPADDEALHLESFEADWIYAAVTGRHAVSLVRALAKHGAPAPMLFADGSRSESLLALAPEALEGSVFLDGPDPELEGRLGEAAIEALERAEKPVDVAAIRGFEASRRLVQAWATSGGATGKKLTAQLEASSGTPGVLGALTFEPYRGVRHYPYTIWTVRKGSFELWPEGLLPTPGCGPPLGFGHPPPAELGKKGKLGYVTYGDSERRTIEQDLVELGLSTGGADPELDRMIRDEIRGRAIRIAHQLFRREADGTPISGWSWGMTFTTEEPPKDVPRSKVWLAFVAGDHPAAGGQVIGSGMVAIYSTFLKRTMYITKKLDPVLSPADRPLLDGTYRWGEDRTLNFRAEKIRCLVDGFSSAVGLTMAHEFGHLCGCGHDTEHPTSIMNVVAGAGASWEAAVWIPSHERSVTTTLGVEKP